MACKNFADSSNTYLAYGVQTECGTPSDTLKFMRTTGWSLQLTAESTQSGEIRSDRNVADQIRTGTSVGGSISGEMSYSDLLPFIEAAIQTTQGSSVAGSWNGKEKTYFTFEDKITANGVDYFRVFSDCEINNLNISLAIGAVVTFTMDVIGRSHTTSSTSIDVDGIESSSSDSAYNTTNHIGSVMLDGAETCDLSSIDIAITNNMREQRSLCATSDLSAAGVASGDFSASGGISIYFPDDVLYNKFLADESFSIKVELDDESGLVTGNKITFEMPRAKFADLNREVSGSNTDIILGGNYQALVNTAGEGALKITSAAKTDA